MITVTKSYLPDKEKYKSYIDRIYDDCWLTNNGPLVRELEQRLQEFLGVKHLILVANGSLALQVLYKVLELKGEVITTPFSFVATTSTLAWEGLAPIFTDIEASTFNINPAGIAELITSETSAILPVHVFGNPCDVNAIQTIADEHDLKVIYDAAHAFGIEYKDKNILNYGDASILSFHATKLFHTIEGGAVITNDDELAKKIRLSINFGITGPTSIASLGINGKMNEFEAAMGLCVLDDIEYITQQRKEIGKVYQKELASLVQFQEFNVDSSNNYAYVPVLFKTEQQLLKVEKALKENNIIPRRYFYPSLDSLTYLKANQGCNISRDIASRVMCLPIYPGLEENIQFKIIKIIKENF